MLATALPLAVFNKLTHTNRVGQVYANLQSHAIKMTSASVKDSLHRNREIMISCIKLLICHILIPF
jgi:hypothetical protein